MTLTLFAPVALSSRMESGRATAATAMPLSNLSGDASESVQRRVFGKTTASKSAPSSPPITTVTAASPEPPVASGVAVLPASVGAAAAPDKVLSCASSPERSLSLSSPSHPLPRSPVRGMQYIQAPGARRRGSSNAAPPRRRSREFVPGPIRRASQVLISLTSPDGASLYGECSRRDSRAVPQITLMSSTFQRLPMKDFGAEVRASMDVDQFLQQAVLLLDVNETSLEGIVDRIVKKVSQEQT